MRDISQRTAGGIGFNLDDFSGSWIKEKENICRGYKESFEDFDFETNCFSYKLLSSSTHPWSKENFIVFSKMLDMTIPSTIEFNLGVYFPRLRVDAVKLSSSINIQTGKQGSLYIHSPSFNVLEKISYFPLNYGLTFLGKDIIRETLRRNNNRDFLLESIPGLGEVKDFRENLEFFEKKFLEQNYFSYLTPNYSGA